jgi:protein-tyrosine phosphatase
MVRGSEDVQYEFRPLRRSTIQDVGGIRPPVGKGPSYCPPTADIVATMASTRPERAAGEILEVAFVCTGNRARSPLAEALFRARVDPLSVKVSSFGTLDLDARPALSDAIAVGRSLGVDLTAHRSRAVQAGGLGGADLVVGFEPSHVAAAVVRGGADGARVFTILELPELLEDLSPPMSLSSIERARYVIEEMHRRRVSHRRSSSPLLRDPYGEPRQVFAEVARMIDVLTSLLASELFAPGG